VLVHKHIHVTSIHVQIILKLQYLISLQLNGFGDQCKADLIVALPSPTSSTSMGSTLTSEGDRTTLVSSSKLLLQQKTSMSIASKEPIAGKECVYSGLICSLPCGGTRTTR